MTCIFLLYTLRQFMSHHRQFMSHPPLSCILLLASTSLYTVEYKTTTIRLYLHSIEGYDCCSSMYTWYIINFCLFCFSTFCVAAPAAPFYFPWYPILFSRYPILTDNFIAIESFTKLSFATSPLFSAIFSIAYYTWYCSYC